jgi:hypothetical protein
LKLGAKSAPAPAEEPTDTAPAEEPEDATQDTSGGDLDFSTDTGDDAATDTGAEDTSSNDKPFDDEPFDAGVEASEEDDPKKFIEQLTGKLGQSLRKYTEDKGEPDFELEKFAVNSLLSATHTGEMDSEDQKDIIKKVKKSGKGDENVDSSEETETTDTEVTDDGEVTDTETTDTEVTDDSENMFETEALDEMSLNDYMTKDLIDLYDNSKGDAREIIFRKVTLTKPFPEKDEKDRNLNREKFLIDLQDDVDKEHLDEIMGELEEMGIYNDPRAKVVKMFENNFILQTPKKNNMFQEGSNDILDEYEIYEVVEEGKKKKKKTKKDACYHKVRARYDVWPSAYASGALVKCRKAGAANWGNSTDESVELTEAVGKEAMKKKCTVIAKRKHNKFPSAKAVEDIVACVAGKIWADEIKKLNEAEELESLKEKWSAKYKKSIDCNNPKGFSQKAHCQGKKKHE